MRSRRRWLHLPHDHGEPIWRSRYDIVAAIVVMSVGMCIWIGAPLATHAVVFDLPVSSGLGKPFEPWPDEVATHLLGVSPEGAILWDDEFIDQGELID